MGDTGPFRSLGALADELVLMRAARCGAGAVQLVLWLRGHGGVRSLGEIWEELTLPLPAVQQLLDRLEAAGLVEHRDMTTDHGTELVWWAPRTAPDRSMFEPKPLRAEPQNTEDLR